LELLPEPSAGDTAWKLKLRSLLGTARLRKNSRQSFRDIAGWIVE
jgi:hypothetical protein